MFHILSRHAGARLWLSFLLFTGVGFLAPATSGEELDSASAPIAATGSITGRVVTPAGAAASDARVDLVDLHRRTGVDGNARFQFASLPPGSYLLEALSRRYGSGVARVEVSAGTEARVEIVLLVASQVDEIVVSGAGDSRSRLELAQPANVLAGEELNLRLQSSLGETLAQEPGVTSTSFGAGASRPVIRGLGGDRVSILTDGLASGDVSNTSPDHAVGIEPGSAERIEVLRGPATLLYGSNAVGGVVNVIDDRIPTYRAEEPLTGSVELRGGSAADERTGSLSLTGGRSSWAWHVDGLHRDAGNYRLASGERLANSDLETRSGAAGATWFLGDRGYVGVGVSALDTQYGLPGDEAVHIDLEQRRLDLRSELTGLTGPFTGLKVRLGGADYEHAELGDEGVGTRFVSDSWEGRLELVQRPRGALTGSVGLQVSDLNLEAIGEEAFIPPSETQAWSLFTLQELRRGKLRFQLGARYESQDLSVRSATLVDRSFNGFSSSAGLVWDTGPDSALALSVSRSTKLPNGEELYSNGLHVATQTFEAGNPELRPETSLGVDVSFRRSRGPVSGELTLFHNRFQGFIYEAFTGEEVADLPVVRYSQADAVLRGAELQTRIELWHGEDRHLDLQVGGDYVRAELRDSGEPLPRIPPLRLGLGLHYHTDRLHTLVEVRRTERQDRVAANETPTDGYTWLNASVSYRFYLRNQVYDLLLRGTNLTDQEGRNHVSFVKDLAPLPGRDLSVSLRFLF